MVQKTKYSNSLIYYVSSSFVFSYRLMVKENLLQLRYIIVYIPLKCFIEALEVSLRFKSVESKMEACHFNFIIWFNGTVCPFFAFNSLTWS